MTTEDPMQRLQAITGHAATLDTGAMDRARARPG